MRPGAEGGGRRTGARVAAAQKACSRMGRRRMRNPASEKLEIIRLVEQSHLPVPAPPFTTGMIFIDPAGLRPWKIVAHSGDDPGGWC